MDLHAVYWLELVIWIYASGFSATYRGLPESTNSDLNPTRHRNVLLGPGPHLSSILRPMQNHKILAPTRLELKTELLNLT